MTTRTESIIKVYIDTNVLVNYIGTIKQRIK